jgi:hypothetical protein
MRVVDNWVYIPANICKSAGAAPYSVEMFFPRKQKMLKTKAA